MLVCSPTSGCPTIASPRSTLMMWICAPLCAVIPWQPPVPQCHTGGTLAAEHVNRQLARAAAKFNLPIAVGSQSSGLRSRGYALRIKWYANNPHGLIMANLSAHASLREARAAVEMLEAQILQLHLNPVQEFIMPEGNASLRDWWTILPTSVPVCPFQCWSKRWALELAQPRQNRRGRRQSH